ncbi:4-coumarate--CoA ligase 1-like [Ixodes scapularis]
MVTARIEDGIVYSPFPEHPPAEISMFEAVRRCLIKHGDKTALVTMLSGPVVVLQQLVKELQRTSARLDSVTKVEACGVLLSKQAAREILSAFNLKGLRNPYGATEGAGMICTPFKNRIAVDTVGFPAPRTQIKVVDTNTGTVLGPGERGQLYIRSPMLLASYRNNADFTSVVFTPDGWMLSGDIGYYDDAGQFYIVERMKDCFKCMERWVLPTDIEAVLLSHADVAEAAVAGVPHDQYNEVAKAFVVLEPASQNKAIRVTENDLQDFVAGSWKSLTDTETRHPIAVELRRKVDEIIRERRLSGCRRRCDEEPWKLAERETFDRGRRFDGNAAGDCC